MPPLGRGNNTRNLVERRRVLIPPKIDHVVYHDKPDHGSVRPNSKRRNISGWPLKVPPFFSITAMPI